LVQENHNIQSDEHTLNYSNIAGGRSEKTLLLISVLLLVATTGCGTSVGNAVDSLWSQSSVYAPSGSIEVNFVRAIADAKGNLHMVWRDGVVNQQDPTKNNTIMNIMYSEKLAGAAWSSPINITNNVPPAVSYLAMLSADAQGNLHVIIMQGNSRSSAVDLYYLTKSAGGSWSKAVNISNTPGNSNGSVIASDAHGNLHVAWIDQVSREPLVYESYYAVKTVGGSWSMPLGIPDGPRYSEQPSIITDASGNVHLSWYINSGNPSTSEIMYAIKPVDGSWSAPENISNTSGMSSFPSISIDARNNLHLLWEDDMSGKYEIVYVTKSPNGSWSKPVAISQGSGKALEAAGVADKQGKLHAVWREEVSGNMEIMYAIKRAGRSWSQPVNVSNTSGASDSPSIAIDAYGNPHIVWADMTSGKRQIMYAAKSAGGS